MFPRPSIRRSPQARCSELLHQHFRGHIAHKGIRCKRTSADAPHRRIKPTATTPQRSLHFLRSRGRMGVQMRSDFDVVAAHTEPSKGLFEELR